MSSCCLMNNPGAGRGRGQRRRLTPQASAGAPPSRASGQGQGRTRRRLRKRNFAEAAAWSPNPMNPPQFFDLPTKDGMLIPPSPPSGWPIRRWQWWISTCRISRSTKPSRWTAGSRTALLGSNKEMDEALTRLGVTHTYETYEGDHTNRVKDRWEHEGAAVLLEEPQGSGRNKKK